MDWHALLETLTPELYQGLKRAVELGKWPDGNRLSSDQVATCMQAVIYYETKHLPADQRTAYMPPKAACATDKPRDDQTEMQTVKWTHGTPEL